MAGSILEPESACLKQFVKGAGLAKRFLALIRDLGQGDGSAGDFTNDVGDLGPVEVLVAQGGLFRGVH